MIVNPQFFNYRLIIGSLVVTIAVLSVFSFISYDSVKEHQQFLEQEKKIVETELSQMIEQYDDVANTNDNMVSQLADVKSLTKSALDSLRILKSDLTVISRFKTQLLVLKKKNNQIFEAIDSVNNVNKKLEKEKLLAVNALKKQINVNSSLLEKNKSLNKTIEKAALLTANSFKTKAYFNSKGKLHETSGANKAQIFEVCFTLAENALTERGKKELFIQIVNPKNNVISNDGFIEFGDSSLIYSSKTSINYENEVVDVCINIVADPPEIPLEKGIYFVSIFHKDQKLGNTKIELK